VGLRRTAFIAALCAVPALADVTVRGDTGLAGPLSSPARDYFGLGVQLGATAGYDVLRYLAVGFRAGYDLVSRNAGSPLKGPGTVLEVGPAVRVHAPWAGSWYVPWVEASLQYARTGELDRVAISASAGLHFPLPGRQLFIGPWLGLTQVFRLADAASYPTHDATILAGGVAVDWSVSRLDADRDADGVADSIDQCPGVAGVAPSGCPPAQTRDARVAQSGPDADPDRDGVLGPADLCPNEPEDHDGFQDDDGCPDLDNDGDGVADIDDACPLESGPPEAHGCPDRDGDGLADHDDSSPGVKGLASAHGCPLYANVTVTDARIELLERVVFSNNGAALAPRSFPALDEVTQALNDRASLCLRVEGHTAGKGDEAYNVKLAQSRADAVRTYLMAHGIAPSRLAAKGLGSKQPIDDNTTLELVILPCEVTAP
jgi:outer membrane protein OmpA-like peptidoglycan-associated protein